MTDEERAQIMSKVRDEVRGLRKRIDDSAADADAPWFKGVLIGLLTSALEDHTFLEEGATRSPGLAAWARRNLLELRVITKFVLASKENARVFWNDFLIDAKEMWEALGAGTEATHSQLVAGLRDAVASSHGRDREFWEAALATETGQPPDTSNPDAEAKAYRELLGERGVPDKEKPRSSRKIAEAVREVASFAPAFKVSSKLMHRTALSIAASRDPAGLAALMPSMRDAGTSDFLEVYCLIRDYVAKNSVALPTT